MAATETVDVTDDTIVTIELPEDFNPETPANKTDGTPAAAATPATPAAPATPATEDAAAALQRSLEEERRLRQAAESRASTASQRAEEAARVAAAAAAEATEARTGIVASQMRETVSNLDSAKRDMQSAKVAYKAAHEAGDADKMADAQEQMSLSAATIRQMEGRKADLEQQAIRAAAEPAEPVRQQPQYTDPVETYLNRPDLSPRARDWLRQHREFLPPVVGGSREKNAMMMRGHHMALAQGFDLDTDDYYRVVEETTGIRQPVSTAARTTPAGGNGATQEVQPQQQQRRQPIPSAPPTNEPASPSGQPNVTKRSFALNKEMQEVALMSFPQKQGEDERAWKQRAFGTYAYNLAEATREGKIGRMTHILPWFILLGSSAFLCHLFA